MALSRETRHGIVLSCLQIRTVRLIRKGENFMKLGLNRLWQYRCEFLLEGDQIKRTSPGRGENQFGFFRRERSWQQRL